MNHAAPSGRRPWLAAVLSLLCTGLGHVYAGRITRGLVLFLLSLLVMPLVAGLSLLEPSKGLLIGMLALGLFLPLLYVFAAVDAWRVARPHRIAYPLREYNRVPLYVLFALIGILYPALSTSVLKAEFLEAYNIATGSMYPTLLEKDRVLGLKSRPGDAAVAHGQVVLFRSPENRDQIWVKRVIALPGDRIAIENGRPVLNGQRVEGVLEGDLVREQLGGHSYRLVPSSASRDLEERVVPPGHVFVLGDNRRSAKDSRNFGFVPIGDVLGPATYIVLPMGSGDRFGLVP